MKFITYFLLFNVLLSVDGSLFGAQDNSKTPGIAQSSEPVYDPREVDIKATILFKPKAEYTPEARRNNISGAVLLEVILSSSGEVRGIKVLNPLPYGLTDSAINASRKVKFKAAIKDGRPVSQRTKFEYNFNIWEKIYYGDRSKMVYYEQGCSNYSKIALSDKIYFKSSKDAKKAGYKKAEDRCP
jgi:TonB family protein